MCYQYCPSSRIFHSGVSQHCHKPLGTPRTIRISFSSQPRFRLGCKSTLLRVWLCLPVPQAGAHALPCLCCARISPSTAAFLCPAAPEHAHRLSLPHAPLSPLLQPKLPSSGGVSLAGLPWKLFSIQHLRLLPLLSPGSCAAAEHDAGMGAAPGCARGDSPAPVPALLILLSLGVKPSPGPAALRGSESTCSSASHLAGQFCLAFTLMGL